MKEGGVRRILGACAVGSLRTGVEPGHFVVCDQLVDRTWGRADTFYDGPVTTHISFADPYCPTARSVISSEARTLSLPVHETGTVVVVQGPRFSTRSESKWFQSQGWEVINMTQYPEASLSRELELCYANISLVTDYDVGVGDRPPVSHEEVVRVFDENLGRLRGVGASPLERLPLGVTELTDIRDRDGVRSSHPLGSSPRLCEEDHVEEVVCLREGPRRARRRLRGCRVRGGSRVRGSSAWIELV